MYNRPIHFEIGGDDPSRLADFYKSVFDWKIQTWGGPQEYWLVTTGPEGSPGIDGALMRRSFPQAVIETIHVESLQDTLKKIEASGGKLVMGPHDIPGVGQHAYCQDPEGNMFGVLQEHPEG